jgi:hypothetical protein
VLFVPVRAPLGLLLVLGTAEELLEDLELGGDEGDEGDEEEQDEHRDVQFPRSTLRE